MAVVLIPQLAPPGLNQSIRLRVTRMWNCVSPASGRIIGLAFLGTDMEGNSVYVQIGQRDVEHYRALLIEGALYLLSAFRVSRPNINMISVRSAHVIWLTSRSVLHPINDDLGPFPRHSFAFNCEHHLRQMANRNRFLTGMLVRDGEVNPFLNSCFATQIYVNLPINETAMVAAIYEDIDGPIEMMPPANQPPNHPPQ
ncbi:hypothetical protein COLO4_26648 [Corchorus olitorius]|uniref:Nucleic acid-binding protein n=1 Tax=Corchorus olitorius TaxID=93759 RepID=A0A1R3HVJ4_9ROSI|nr:hypothetical protein COLO4_26648 [Corchorus olitorius]